MQKRKLMISILAAISVTVSTTFGVMALNASAPDASKAAAEQLEVTTVPAPTTAVAEPAIERIVDLSVDKAEASGSEGDVITLKTKANTNEKITYIFSNRLFRIDGGQTDRLRRGGNNDHHQNLETESLCS